MWPTTTRCVDKDARHKTPPGPRGRPPRYLHQTHDKTSSCKFNVDRAECITPCQVGDEVTLDHGNLALSGKIVRVTDGDRGFAVEVVPPSKEQVERTACSGCSYWKPCVSESETSVCEAVQGVRRSKQWKYRCPSRFKLCESVIVEEGLGAIHKDGKNCVVQPL